MVLVELGFIGDVLWSYVRYLAFVLSCDGEHFISRAEFSDTYAADEDLYPADEGTLNK